MKATYNATTNYKSNFATKTITIGQATPVVTWSNPQAIDYGTALSSTQVNAEANLLGSFGYDPLAGTVLLSGTQTLKATFTPTDTANYNCANARSHALSTPIHSPASSSRSTWAASSTR